MKVPLKLPKIFRRTKSEAALSLPPPPKSEKQSRASSSKNLKGKLEPSNTSLGTEEHKLVNL